MWNCDQIIALMDENFLSSAHSTIFYLLSFGMVSSEFPFCIWWWIWLKNHFSNVKYTLQQIVFLGKPYIFKIFTITLFSFRKRLNYFKKDQQMNGHMALLKSSWIFFILWYVMSTLSDNTTAINSITLYNLEK